MQDGRSPAEPAGFEHPVALRCENIRPMAKDASQTLRDVYARLSPIPGGKGLFSRMIGFMAPYTGTIGARVEELKPGYSRIRMRDRRRVRNHLRSVHAMALCNLAEVSTGLALLFGLPDGSRGILTGFSIRYLKKARGTLTATCRCDPPDTNERQEYEVRGEITNQDGVVVAEATAHWLIGPA